MIVFSLGKKGIDHWDDELDEFIYYYYDCPDLLKARIFVSLIGLVMLLILWFYKNLNTILERYY